MDGLSAFIGSVQGVLDPVRLLERHLGEDKQAAPWQCDLIRHAMQPGTSTAALVCRRAGKSTACSVLAASILGDPIGDKVVLLFASTLAQAQLLKRSTEQVLKLVDLGIIIERETLTEIYLSNGSSLHVLAVGSEGTSARGWGMGKNGGAVIVDEAAFVPSAAYDAILPLTEAIGSLVLVTTPTSRPAGPGIVPFYDIWTDEKQFPDFKRITAPASSLPYMAEKVARAKRTMSAHKFKREYGVEWLAAEGYALFDADMVNAAFTEKPGLQLGDFYVGT